MRGCSPRRRRTGVATAADAIAHAAETQAVQAGRGTAASQFSQGQSCGAVEYSHDCALLAGGGQLAAIVGQRQSRQLVVVRCNQGSLALAQQLNADLERREQWGVRGCGGGGGCTSPRPCWSRGTPRQDFWH